MRKNFSQTYLLIGLYIDLYAYRGFESRRIQREKIRKKLLVRWEKGIDRDAFERYFKDHHITIEDLEL